MYISFSGFKMYTSCPLAYWHNYVMGTPPPEPDNAVNALYGSVVGVLFEDFYTQRIWRNKDFVQVLLNRVESTYDKVLADQQRRGRALKWKTGEDPRPNYHSKEELLADVRDAVPRGIRIIRFDKLIGPRAEAETKLNVKIRDYVIGGRADFIIQRVKPHEDLVILDGKGSKHRDAFVDPRQLKWYALQYSLRNSGQLPDRLGFVYWRFDPPEAVDWVAFSQSDVDELLDEILGTLAAIERGTTRRAGESLESTKRYFPPRPSRETCRFCVFLQLCPEGQEVMTEKIR